MGDRLGMAGNTGCRAWNKSLPGRHTNGLGMFDQEMTSHYYSTYISVLEVQFTGS